MKKHVGYEKPQLTELSMLQDTAHGFSEPDPPGQQNTGGGDKDRETQQDPESFDWL